MLTPRKSELLKRVLLLVVAVLAIGYFAVFGPVQRRAAALDSPLTQVWRRLNAAHVGGTPEGAIDLIRSEAILAQTLRLSSNFHAVSNQLAARIEPAAAVRARLSATFQLVAYENERQLRIEQLRRAATEGKVTLAPGLTNWFPEYSAEIRRPWLLWAQLWFADELLRTAIACKAGEIRSLAVVAPPAQGSTELIAAGLDETSIRLELAGGVEPVSLFLRSLPLRGEELKRANLPPGSASKPYFFVDRLLLRRAQGAPQDLVNVELRVRGFVPRESTNVPPAAALVAGSQPPA